MAQSIWNNVLAELKNKINPQSFDMMFKNTRARAIEGDSIVITVPDGVIARHLNDKYKYEVEQIIEKSSGIKYSCKFIKLDENSEDSPKEPTITQTINIPRRNIYLEEQDSSPLNPDYTFENFIVGPNNNLAHAAAEGVAKSPASENNPLFIYGKPGVGKTHLIQAIGHQILKEKPFLKVMYTPTENFMNEFLKAIQTNTTHSFKIKYRNIDILIIDDIQFLEKKEQLQEEFFHTFNTLYDNKKQIIISSDRPPKQIATLEERLRTRFEWGTLADIQVPSLETREAILRNKASKEDIEILDEAYHYIARRITSNIRSLESALATMKIVYDLYKEPITIKHVKNNLKALFDEETNKNITASDIMTRVASHFEVTVENLISKSRQRQIADARFVSMYIIRKLTEKTTSEIGKLFGNRDHSTVVNAINNIENEMKKNQEFKEQIEELISEIKS